MSQGCSSTILSTLVRTLDKQGPHGGHFLSQQRSVTKKQRSMGAGESAETLPTDFFNDLQCFC
jgi:hypothetical protein